MRQISFKEFCTMMGNANESFVKIPFLLPLLFKFYIKKEEHEYTVVAITPRRTLKIIFFIPVMLFTFFRYLWKYGVKEFFEDFPMNFFGGDDFTIRIKKSP